MLGRFCLQKNKRGTGSKHQPSPANLLLLLVCGLRIFPMYVTPSFLSLCFHFNFCLRPKKTIDESRAVDRRGTDAAPPEARRRGRTTIVLPLLPLASRSWRAAEPLPAALRWHACPHHSPHVDAQSERSLVPPASRDEKKAM